MHRVAKHRFDPGRGGGPEGLEAPDWNDSTED